jgi:hypothetical protein
MYIGSKNRKLWRNYDKLMQDPFWFSLVWFGLVWFGLVWLGKEKEKKGKSKATESMKFMCNVIIHMFHRRNKFNFKIMKKGKTQKILNYIFNCNFSLSFKIF